MNYAAATRDGTLFRHARLLEPPPAYLRRGADACQPGLHLSIASRCSLCKACAEIAAEILVLDDATARGKLLAKGRAEALV